MREKGGENEGREEGKKRSKGRGRGRERKKRWKVVFQENFIYKSRLRPHVVQKWPWSIRGAQEIAVEIVNKIQALTINQKATTQLLSQALTQHT